MLKVLLSFLLLFSFAANADLITLNKNNFVLLADEVNEITMAQTSMALMEKCALNPGKDLYLLLYSPGGSVSDGKTFIDFANALPCKINPVTMFAASMAYQISQNMSGTRYILPSGILMSHRASVSGISGQFPGEIYNRMNYLMDMVTELDKRTATKIGISLEQYRKEIHDELWLTHDIALRRNHADKSALVTCDSSLAGTYWKDIPTQFGVFKVKMSNCPIILGPLDIQFPQGKVNQKAEEAIKDFFNPAKVKIIYGY